MTHTDDQLGRHEAELHDLLQRTVNAVPVPVGLAPSALQHGRRQRTRRRVVCMAGGATAASVAAALIVSMARGGGAESVVDPAGRPSSSATSSSPPTPAPAELPDGWWNMPAIDMVAAASAIVPDGVTVTSPGPLTADTPEGGPATGWINSILDGPDGPGRLNVMLFTTPELSNTSQSTTEQLDDGAQMAAGEGQSDYLSCTAPAPAPAGPSARSSATAKARSSDGGWPTAPATS
jgi:hypothetical protein